DARAPRRPRPPRGRALSLHGSEERRETRLAEGLREERLHHPAHEVRELRLPETELLAERRSVGTAELHGDIGPRRRVAERGLERAPEEAMRLRVEPADDAPVEDAEPPVAEEEHVARVHVAVKRPLADRNQDPRAHNR